MTLSAQLAEIRALPQVRPACFTCRDRPATRGGLCWRCWAEWCHAQAAAVLREGAVAEANALKWEAIEAERRLGGKEG